MNTQNSLKSHNISTERKPHAVSIARFVVTQSASRNKSASVLTGRYGLHATGDLREGYCHSERTPTAPAQSDLSWKEMDSS